MPKMAIPSIAMIVDMIADIPVVYPSPVLARVAVAPIYVAAIVSIRTGHGSPLPAK